MGLSSAIRSVRQANAAGTRKSKILMYPAVAPGFWHNEAISARDWRGMKNSKILAREVGDEVVVLDTDSDRIHQLNTTASIIWRMHVKGADEEEIARALVLEFDVEYASAKKDVRETLMKFQDLGLESVDDNREMIRED